MYTPTYSKMSLPSFPSVHGLWSQVQTHQTHQAFQLHSFPTCLSFLLALPWIQSYMTPCSSPKHGNPPFCILYPIPGKPVCMSITWLSWCPMPAGSRSLWQAMPARPPALSPSLPHPACSSFTRPGLLQDKGGIFYPAFPPPPPSTHFGTWYLMNKVISSCL